MHLSNSCVIALQDAASGSGSLPGTGISVKGGCINVNIHYCTALFSILSSKGEYLLLIESGHAACDIDLFGIEARIRGDFEGILFKASTICFCLRQIVYMEWLDVR